MRYSYPPELVATLVLVRLGRMKRGELRDIIEHAHRVGLIEVEPDTALERVEEHLGYLVERGIVEVHNDTIVVRRYRVPLVPLRTTESILRVLGIHQRHAQPT